MDDDLESVDGNGNNKSGFSALPVGMCTEEGEFFGHGTQAHFWTSTDFVKSSAIDVTNFNDGTPITRAKNPKEFEDLGESKIPAYIIYENKVSNRNDYGLLYNHYAVASEHGLAPIGYNVPTVEDFGILIGRFGIHDKASKVLISVNGKKSKSGFDALLGGCIHYGRYDGINQDAKFWTISLWDANNKKQPAKEAFYEVFNNGIGITETNSRPFSFGFSVRCIKNVFGNPKTPAKTVTKVVKSKK